MCCLEKSKKKRRHERPPLVSMRSRMWLFLVFLFQMAKELRCNELTDPGVLVGNKDTVGMKMLSKQFFGFKGSWPSECFFPVFIFTFVE